MASLFNPESAHEVTLLAPSQLGRSRHCTIVVKDPQASMLHALIFRRDGAWWLQSLAKTNGTWIDGELLRMEQLRRITRGARLRLGRAGTDPKFDWVLVDDSPPLPTLIRDGAEPIPLALGRTRLPSPALQSAVVWRELSSAGESLTLECGEESRPLADGEVFELATRKYRVQFGEELNTTVSAASREEVEMKIWVSRCQEDIRIELSFAGLRQRLRVSSEQAEVVLRYAEERLAQRLEGVSGELEGYTDEMPQLLKLDRLLFNTYCSRINKAARKTGLVPGGTLIHCHKATGRRRIEVGNIEIL